MNDSFIKNHYDRHYQRKGTDISRIEWTPVIRWVKQGSLVLDVACGDGNLGKILAETKGVTVDGFEVSEVAAVKARGRGYRQVELLDINNSSLPCADNSYDHVLLIDILEHVFKPLDLLIEAQRVARKSVIFATPNLANFVCRAQMLWGGFPNAALFGENWYDSGHIRLAAYCDMKKEIESRGWTITKKAFIMPLYHQYQVAGFSRAGIPIWLKIIDWLYRPFILIAPNLFSLIYVIEIKK